MIDEIIQELNQLLILQKSNKMTESQLNYAAGIADSIEIIKKYYNQRLVVGNKYYVLLKNQFQEPNIELMKLYRINQTKRTSYCFTKDLSNNKNPNPDLVLNSKGSLKMRVFKTREEAEKGKKIFMINYR